MQELNLFEVDEVGGGIVFLVPLAPIAVEVAAGVLATGVAAFVSFTYLRSTANHKH